MEQRIKASLVERAETALEAAAGLLPPPPPPFPPPGMGEEPDAAAFIGSIIFFISFASAFADMMESEHSASLFSPHGEYSDAPVYSALALGVGSVSYFLAFLVT